VCYLKPEEVLEFFIAEFTGILDEFQDMQYDFF